FARRARDGAGAHGTRDRLRVGELAAPKRRNEPASWSRTAVRAAREIAAARKRASWSLAREAHPDIRRECVSQRRVSLPGLHLRRSRREAHAGPDRSPDELARKPRTG